MATICLNKEIFMVASFKLEYIIIYSGLRNLDCFAISQKKNQETKIRPIVYLY